MQTFSAEKKSRKSVASDLCDFGVLYDVIEQQDSTRLQMKIYELIEQPIYDLISSRSCYNLLLMEFEPGYFTKAHLEKWRMK